VKRVSRLVGLVGAAFLAAAGVVVAATAPTVAIIGTFTVDSAGDAAPVAAHCTTPVPGACTLRDAFAAANGVNAPETITISVAGPINLTQGELLYNGGGGNNALIVNGNGATVNQATGGARVFNSTTTGLLTLNAMTITGGNVSSADGAGGAVDSIGPLTITNSTVSHNSSASTGTGLNNGADIFRTGASTTGTFNATNVTIDSNTITGTGASSNRGIVDAGTTTVTNSALTNNTSVASGTGDSDGVLDTTGTTVTNTTISGNPQTAAVNNASGTLDVSTITMTGSTVSANTVTSGRTDNGIFNSGSVTVAGSSIVGNTDTAAGTGAANGTLDTGDVTVTDSQVSGNTTRAAGTGHANGTFDSGVVTLTRSSVTSNTNSSTAGGAFGGIDAGSVTATNSTISDNTSAGVTSTGGGIADGPGSASQIAARSRPAGKHGDRGVSAQADTTSLVYATVTGNAAQTGANIFSNNPLIAFGSVVALPHGGVNCVLEAGTTSNGWNFSDDVSCGFTNTANGDRQNAGDPRLAGLANNGGPGLTRMPLPGSPLIDAIPNASCQADGAAGITTDERGVVRPEGPGCDIGAVEVEVIVVTPRFTG
jgi:hypothetical protein